MEIAEIKKKTLGRESLFITAILYDGKNIS